jgi:hypothetical protein
MTIENRRRRYLVKHWFQVRYMLLLVGGVVAGGIVYAMILQAVLRQRMELMVASGGTGFSGSELWFSLYPMVAICTLSLFVIGTLLLFLLFQIFVSRVSRASSRLEQYYRGLANDGISAPLEGHREIPEFHALAERTTELVLSYQRKWSTIAATAEEISAAAGALAGEIDPHRRILALRDCEHRAALLDVSGGLFKSGGK